ncbi:MAG: hypothetical protein OXE40_01845 [Gammaproteobacteria bacterium]|nr:hypothetical protein [Gammaproteobacteria bacterium]
METPAVVAAIRLLMLTGCRLGEIRTLRWEDVDLDAAELRWRDDKSGAKMIPLNGPALEFWPTRCGSRETPTSSWVPAKARI